MLNIHRYFLALLIIVLFTAYISYAQTRDKGYSINNTRADTILIKDWLHRSEILRHSNYDSANVYAMQALRLSKAINSNKYIATALLNIAGLANDHENFKVSHSYITLAEPFCRKAYKEQPMLLPRFYNCYASILSNTGTNDSAIDYFYKGIAAFKAITPAQKDSNVFMYLVSNLGITLASLTQVEKSIPYFKTGLQLALKYNDTYMTANNYRNLGVSYHLLGSLDTAGYYYSKAMGYYSAKDTYNIMTAYYTIGALYAKTKGLKEAQLYFDSAIQVSPLLASKSQPLQRYLGDICYEQKKYLQAIHYYKKSMELSRLKGNLLNLYNLEIFSSIAKCYYFSGQKDSAYSYMRTYADLRDSTINSEKIQTANKLEIQYRVSEQQKQLAASKLALARKERAIIIRNVWIIGIASGLLLLSVLAFFIFRGYRHKQGLQAANLERLQLQQEANHLLDMMKGEENERTRIARDLHDGVASILSAAKMNLCSINTTQLAKQDNDTYGQGLYLLDEAYNGIRQTAHNLLTPAQIMQQGLYETTARYCEKISHTEKLRVNFQSYGHEPEIDAGIAQFLFRIIQELLHNTQKHANASEVIVELGADEATFKIMVEDNGNGMFKESEGKGEGIGLYHLEERIKTMGGTMETDSRKGIGTTIYLMFDLMKIIRSGN